MCLPLCRVWMIVSYTENANCILYILRITAKKEVRVWLELTLSHVNEAIKLLYSPTVRFWIGHIRNFYIHCFWSNRLPMGSLIGFHQFSILLAYYSILLDGIVGHLLLFLRYLSHRCNLVLGGRLWLTLVVTQTITQVIFNVGSVCFSVMIGLIVDFILLK